MQVAMGFVQLPDAGQHATVFVGIGIAQHDFLPASPGIERRLIVRGSPDPFHHRSRSAQGLNRFEKRHRHQSRVIRGSRDAHAAGGRQFRDREDVVFRLRSADDVAANRACGIDLLQLGDLAQGVENVLSRGGKSFSVGRAPARAGTIDADFHLRPAPGHAGERAGGCRGLKDEIQKRAPGAKADQSPVGPAAARDSPPGFRGSAEDRFRILWQTDMTLPVPALRGFGASERLSG